MSASTPSSAVKALLAAGMLAAGVSAQEVPTPLGSALPDLASHSSWAQDTVFAGARPAKRMRGVYPVGNGHVFAYMGLGVRANTMQAITGPQYQTDELFAPKGHFGELTLDLLPEGEPVDLPLQRVRRVRGANFVVTNDYAPNGLSLRTLTFATPGRQHLTRVIDVHNEGTTALTGLVLRATPEQAIIRGDALVSEYQSEIRPALAYFALSNARVTDDAALHVDLGTLAGGATWTGTLTISTVAGAQAPAEWAPEPANIERATADARTTVSWWKSKLATTSEFDSDHRKLDDLVRDWKVMMLVQRCARAGVVSPMVNYRGAFVRDSIGPMMTFLRFHMWDEARATLEYFFDATRLLGRVPERTVLDLDLSKVAGPTNWATVEVPEGEIPSWIILQHFWYWRATQDAALISKHWPLLDACLKRQKRANDNLMTFQGTEPYLHGALYSLYPDRVKGTTGFIAEDHLRDRKTYSLASAVQFLMSVHAMGAMVNGLDRATNPERWVDGKPKDHPGLPYLTRGYELRTDIEERFWLPEEKLFAPAISPVTGAPHRAPFADVNLMPLWVGWTYPSGEKSRDNLRHTLAMLWRSGTRIGTTPTVGYVTGKVQGMLLTALAERDGRARLDCLDELLRMAEPAGEWGELYDPEGRPVSAYDAEWPNRLRPWESGVNLEAIMFAMTGIRFNFIPDWDNDEIRAKLRMPHGATHVTLKNIEKDGRRIHLYMTETHRKFSDEEREANAGKVPEKQLDPNAAHRRLDFRMELVSDNPPKGYYDAFLNVLNTVFIRYLWKASPVSESQLWNEDTLAFFPEGERRMPWKHLPLQKKDGATMVVFTARSAGASIGDPNQVTLIDTGLAMRSSDIVRMLVGDDGTPAHAAAYFDWGWDARGATTFKSEEFWSDEAIARALQQFAAAGGQVLRPGYFEHYDVSVNNAWQAVKAPAGRLSLDAAVATARIVFSSDAKREAVLRLGSSCGLSVELNGEQVFSRNGERDPLPDADAALVRLRQGDNTLQFTLSNGDGAVLFARLSDPKGLPMPGIVGR